MKSPLNSAAALETKRKRLSVTIGSDGFFFSSFQEIEAC